MSNLVSGSATRLSFAADNLWLRAEQVLSRSEYSVLRLHYAEECDPASIARILGFSPFYVRFLLFRARRKLFPYM